MASINLTTVVALVLDETGSMHETLTDTIGAVNGYLDGLETDTPDALISVMTFSDTYGAEPTFRVHASAVRPADVPRLTVDNYRPRGNTPLYDAIGKAITETEQVEADRYLLVVMTDGYENASQEYHARTVKQLNALRRPAHRPANPRGTRARVRRERRVRGVRDPSQPLEEANKLFESGDGEAG